jgi:hypothetical protein
MKKEISPKFGVRQKPVLCIIVPELNLPGSVLQITYKQTSKQQKLIRPPAIRIMDRVSQGSFNLKRLLRILKNITQAKNRGMNPAPIRQKPA